MDERLVSKARNEAVKAALATAQSHGLKLDAGELSQELKGLMADAIEEGLRDAREALECGMGDIAEATFRSSCWVAGCKAVHRILDRKVGVR